MLFNIQWTMIYWKEVSVTNAEGPPVPIPNTEVKLCSGENTLRATVREDSSMLTQSRSGEIHSDDWKTEKNYEPFLWGCSSAGRAPALQAGGHGFESHHLHQASKACANVHWKPNKTKETKQIVVYWEKLVIEIFFSKRFFRTKEVGKNNFVSIK